MRLNNSDTLSRWFLAFNLQRLPLMGCLKGLGSHVPTIANAAGAAGFGKASECWYLCLVSGTAFVADPDHNWGAGSPPALHSSQRAEETQTRDISAARNCTRISTLELESNLQKQIFLSERICLAFTPRNQPRAGSP